MMDVGERAKIIFGVLGGALIAAGLIKAFPEAGNPVALIMIGFIILLLGLRR
jgi:hypothetical protein